MSIGLAVATPSSVALV